MKMNPLRELVTTKTPNRLSTGPLHLMILPAGILLFIFSYLPMFGIIIAFQDFDIFLGLKAFWKSEWVGLDNYTRLIAMKDPVKVVINTFIISFWKITGGFLVPVIVAILLNEIKFSPFKRTVQTIMYMPHFLSWVIMAGIVKQILFLDGIVNEFIVSLLNIDPIPFLQSILNAGFDQIFNLSTAIGLFKSSVSLVFISLSYFLAYRFANYQIF